MALYKMRALERLADMEGSDMPFSVWLPYTLLNSERFVFEETGEVWHRFNNVTLYVENEEYPAGDLIDETEEAAAGFVCWQRKNGRMPEVGDVFQVVDGKNQVLFEEIISDESFMFGKKYMTAEQKEPMVCERLFEMGQEFQKGLDGSFTDSFMKQRHLKEYSHLDFSGREVLPVRMRGLDFRVVVSEYEVNKDIGFNVYTHNDEGIRSQWIDLVPGDKWCEVKYAAAAEPEKTRLIGCGLGELKAALPIITKCLDLVRDKAPLNQVLSNAKEASMTLGGSESKIEKEIGK